MLTDTLTVSPVSRSVVPGSDHDQDEEEFVLGITWVVVSVDENCGA